MPRKKKVSDELYNLRRRLNRNIASLEKADRLTEGQRSNLEYFKQMRGELTTIRGQRSASDILHSESAQKLKWRLENALQRQGIRGEQRRRLDFEKDVFSASLQEAGRKSDSTPSRASLQAVVFMQATKQHWQGLPADQRIDAVLEGLGVNSLSAALEIVKANNPEVFAQLQGPMQAASSDDDGDFEGYDSEGNGIFEEGDEGIVNYPSKRLLGIVRFV